MYGDRATIAVAEAVAVPASADGDLGLVRGLRGFGNRAHVCLDPAEQPFMGNKDPRLALLRRLAKERREANGPLPTGVDARVRWRREPSPRMAVRLSLGGCRQMGWPRFVGDRRRGWWVPACNFSVDSFSDGPVAGKLLQPMELGPGPRLQ